MSYKLKEIGYLVRTRTYLAVQWCSTNYTQPLTHHHHHQTRRVHILLQNENGPCPLLAAANCLLLRNAIQLSPLSKDHGFLTLDDLINMLAEFAVSRNNSSSFHVEELLKYLPRFQYGMGTYDVRMLCCVVYMYILVWAVGCCNKPTTTTAALESSSVVVIIILPPDTTTS